MVISGCDTATTNKFVVQLYTIQDVTTKTPSRPYKIFSFYIFNKIYMFI